MKRGEIRFADVGSRAGRRPVLILNRSDHIAHLNAVTCAMITTSLRDIRTRLALGANEGLSRPSEAICDQLLALDKANIDTVPIGLLDHDRLVELDRVLSYALDIRKENLD